ncbi:unnamed protein product [Oncorhynchus mykiss]|uniref:Uncharacterized protein n=1 Tax=Oncorhynchus mykiss TaxID=8022 RepID=A0A060WE40_ONCMY|nr:unnamed protein product [Oncorhynchus mykiss]
MAQRLKAALPVASTLLEPCVVTDVLVKLRHRRQVSKFIYDKSAKDLPELRVGEMVRMKPDRPLETRILCTESGTTLLLGRSEWITVPS